MLLSVLFLILSSKTALQDQFAWTDAANEFIYKRRNQHTKMAKCLIHWEWNRMQIQQEAKGKENNINYVPSNFFMTILCCQTCFKFKPPLVRSTEFKPSQDTLTNSHTGLPSYIDDWANHHLSLINNTRVQHLLITRQWLRCRLTSSNLLNRSHNKILFNSFQHLMNGQFQHPTLTWYMYSTVLKTRNEQDSIFVDQ